MLRVGLTGGIGSGKSTVSRRLGDARRGRRRRRRRRARGRRAGRADAAAIGSASARVSIRADGALDRAALGRHRLPRPARPRRDLEAITHPRSAARVAGQRCRRPGDGVSVLRHAPARRERPMGARATTSSSSWADEETRVRRLVEQRGMPGGGRPHRDRRAGHRRSSGGPRPTSWLDNDGHAGRAAGAGRRACGPSASSRSSVNLATGTRSRRSTGTRSSLLAPGPAWPARRARLLAAAASRPSATSPSRRPHRLDLGAGARRQGRHRPPVGVTSSPTPTRRRARMALTDAGYVSTLTDSTRRTRRRGPRRVGQALLRLRPHEPVHVHVREKGSAGWRFALLFRNWLRHEPAERDVYAAEKRRLSLSTRARPTTWRPRSRGSRARCEPRPPPGCQPSAGRPA